MHELTGLRPLNPAVHEDDWPNLDLTDVTVWIKKGGTEELADFFDVAEKGPFRVKGKLRPVPKRFKKIGPHTIRMGKRENRGLILVC
jgi:hypothetical protein